MSSVSNSVSRRAVAKQDLFRCNSEAIIIQIGEKTCALLRRFLDALVSLVPEWPALFRGERRGRRGLHQPMRAGLIPARFERPCVSIHAEDGTAESES